MKTVEIVTALRSRYPAEKGEWAFFTEVPNATGFQKSRSCDALAMGLWPSTNFVIHGHEVKASRSDWQREMQDPEKAEAFARYCDYWWIVSPANVLAIEELPADWGWICTYEHGASRVKKPANKRTPEVFPREFLAGVMRSIAKADSVEIAIRAAEKQGWGEGYKAGLKEGKRSFARICEVESLEKQVLELKGYVGEFEKLKLAYREGNWHLKAMRRSTADLIHSLQSIVEVTDKVCFGLDKKEAVEQCQDD
jgi:hypothetical protein